MKKNTLFIILTLFSSISLQSQVGINTQDPKTTLHVNTSPNLAPDGIIAPNLTLAQLKDRDSLYGDDQKGAFVYVTNITGTTSVKTKSITATGYYYFDGSAWVQFGSGTIATGNGLSLTNNIIDLGGNLNKSTTLDTKGNTFSIIGSGTSSGLTLPTGASAGKVLTSNSTGEASWTSPGFSEFKQMPGFNISNQTFTSGVIYYYTGISFTLGAKGTYFVTLSVRMNINSTSADNAINYDNINAGMSGMIMRPTSNPSDYINNANRFIGTYEQYPIVLNRGTTQHQQLLFNINQTLTSTQDSQNVYLLFWSDAAPSLASKVTYSIMAGETGSQTTGGSFVRIN